MADAIVVFGCAVHARGLPPAALVRRLHGALAAARAHPDACLLLSGGARPGQPPEAMAMAAWLLAHAMPEARLQREAHARDTLQNARLCASLLASLGSARAHLLTERYHMRRSLALLRAALSPRGVAVLPLPVDDGLGPVAARVQAAVEAGKLARDWAALALWRGRDAPAPARPFG